MLVVRHPRLAHPAHRGELKVQIDNVGSVAEPVPVLFDLSRSRCEGPGSGSTLDKTEEILNEIFSIRYNID